MKINYNNKIFKVVKTSGNGEVDESLLFHYKQKEAILTCTYSGGKIVKGQILGVVDLNGNIEMKYQQLNINGQFNTGMCKSKPRFTSGGKLLLEENWQWTSGDFSKGKSLLEEVIEDGIFYKKMK